MKKNIFTCVAAICCLLLFQSATIVTQTIQYGSGTGAIVATFIPDPTISKAVAAGLGLTSLSVTAFRENNKNGIEIQGYIIPSPIPVFITTSSTPQ